MSVFYDPAVLGYHTPGHPESPERVSKTSEQLKSAGHAVRLPSRRASEADVLLAHAPEHLAAIGSGDYQDADTPRYPRIKEIALTGLSGSLSAADSAEKGMPAFSLMRPPGHHAGKNRVAGFCYFNNIAIACLDFLAKNAGARAAILDIDVHHGDGTQDIMLKHEGRVLFASLHQVPLYPGTGLKSVGNCYNFPLPPGTDGTPYLKTLEKALALILDFKPQLLAVSAGFDTYKECPIAGLKLDRPDYRRIGAMIAETKLPRFAALEGGYAEALPQLIESFLAGFF